MKKPPDKTAQDAGRRRPDYVIELAVSPELRDRAQRPWVARSQARGSARRKAAEPDPDRRQADREAEP